MKAGCSRERGHGNLTAGAMVYEIRVEGRLDSDRWSEWFEGMAVIAGTDGETVLLGPVADQAALYGLLARLRDLALTLLSVQRMGPRT